MLLQEVCDWHLNISMFEMKCIKMIDILKGLWRDCQESNSKLSGKDLGGSKCQ